MFDKKIKRVIIHHARQRSTESVCRFEFEIHHFIYFPTPLYTKTRCQAGFCVCGDFLLWESMAEKKKATFRGDRYEKWFYERNPYLRGVKWGIGSPSTSAMPTASATAILNVEMPLAMARSFLP